MCWEFTFLFRMSKVQFSMKDGETLLIWDYCWQKLFFLLSLKNGKLNADCHHAKWETYHFFRVSKHSGEWVILERAILGKMIEPVFSLEDQWFMLYLLTFIPLFFIEFCYFSYFGDLVVSDLVILDHTQFSNQLKFL